VVFNFKAEANIVIFLNKKHSLRNAFKISYIEFKMQFEELQSDSYG